MNYYLIDYKFIPIIDVGDLNETIYLNHNFQQLFMSNLSIEEIENKIIEVIESPKLGMQQIPELKFLDFHQLYFMKDNEGNHNWKIYQLTDFLKGMISKI